MEKLRRKMTIEQINLMLLSPCAALLKCAAAFYCGYGHNKTKNY